MHLSYPVNLALDAIVVESEASVRELGNYTLKKIAVELTEKLRRSVKVDWAVRVSIRVQPRVMVRTLLKKYKYPPDQQESATETVLKQAETLSGQWTSDLQAR